MASLGSPTSEAASLRVHVAATHTSLWIELDGEVDISNQDRLRAALFCPDPHDARRIYLDLRKLTFCDTAGCRLLLLFNAEARMYGHEVRFVGPRPLVRKVLAILAQCLTQGDGPNFL